MAFDIGYDEGGSGDTLLVSMHAGITQQVKKLTRQWKSRLGQVEFFHSKELWNFSKGVFTRAGLTRDERGQLVKDLAKLIHRHLAVGITAKISKELYQSETDAKFRAKYGTAYSFAVYTMLLVYADLEPEKPCEVNLLLEDGHANIGQAIDILQGFKTSPPRALPNLKIFTVGAGSKSDHPILQSADMLVYAKQQEITQRDRAIYDALYPIQKAYIRYDFICDKETIQSVKDGVSKWLKHRKDFWNNKHRS